MVGRGVVLVRQVSVVDHRRSCVDNMEDGILMEKCLWYRYVRVHKVVSRVQACPMMQEEYNARDKTSKNAQKRLQQSKQVKAVDTWDTAHAVDDVRNHSFCRS